MAKKENPPLIARKTPVQNSGPLAQWQVLLLHHNRRDVISCLARLGKCFHIMFSKNNAINHPYFDGWNPIHKNVNLGMADPIALLTLSWTYCFLLGMIVETTSRFPGNHSLGSYYVLASKGCTYVETR